MPTIYEETPGALIPSGERTVATYASGLCRVDQVYVCNTDNAATHRATLAVGASMPDGNDAPATDGLYIFPNPQEIKKPEGFTEFHVSAYGRTTTGIQGVYLEQETISNPYFSYNVWKVTGSMAIPSGESVSLEDLDIEEDFFTPFGVVFAVSNKTVTSVTQISQSDAGLPSDATFMIGGSSYTVPYPRLNVRIFEVAYTLDGTPAADVFRFALLDPEVVIVAARNFGSFTELEITTQREGTTPEIV